MSKKSGSHSAAQISSAFFIAALASLGVLWFSAVDRVQEHFQGALRSLEVVRDTHGLNTDLPSLDTLLINLIERTEGVFVKSVEIHAAQGQTLLKGFVPNRRVFADLHPFALRFEGVFDEYQVSIELLMRWRDLFTFLVESLLIGLVSAIGVTAFRKLQATRTERIIIDRNRALALQVAHDIRSPLAALKVFLSRSSLLSSDERDLVVGAAARIHEIATGLLEQNHPKPAPKKVNSPGLDPAQLITELVREKQSELGSKAELKFESALKSPSERARIEVKPIDFFRVLSNLVNNAAEAYAEERGQVRISLGLDHMDRYVVITIRDWGRGMSEKVLAQLGTRGLTVGKQSGNGFGVSHAIEMVKQWGGMITFHSQLGQGTEAVLRLPLASI